MQIFWQVSHLPGILKDEKFYIFLASLSTSTSFKTTRVSTIWISHQYHGKEMLGGHSFLKLKGPKKAAILHTTGFLDVFTTNILKF